MRICAGRFEKGMEVYHVQGGKKIKLAQPQQLMAQEREIIEEAYEMCIRDRCLRFRLCVPNAGPLGSI